MSRPVKHEIFSAIEESTYGRKLTVSTVDAPDGSRSYEFTTVWPGTPVQSVTITQAQMDDLINTVQ